MFGVSRNLLKARLMHLAYGGTYDPWFDAILLDEAEALIAERKALTA